MTTKNPNIRLGGYSSIFGVNESKRIIIVSLDELHQHPGLHVSVAHDSYLDELTESIKKNGLFEDIRAFPDPKGGYWIISGRHRCEAAKQAGLQEVSVILDDTMTLEEAEIAITDCNLRHKLSIMERAWTYRIKKEAESRQGYRSDIHGKIEQTTRPSEGERTIQRFIRLTYLVPELQEIAGKGRLSVRAGAALSYLSEGFQHLTAKKIEEAGTVPNMNIAEQWKKMYARGTLTTEILVNWFSSNYQGQGPYKVSLSYDKFSEFIPKKFTKEETEELICRLLKEWSNDRHKGEGEKNHHG